MSAGQHAAVWPVGPQQQQQHRPPSPPIMSANANGPVDPHEFYTSFSSTSSAATAPQLRGQFIADDVQSFPSFSQSPERARLQPSAISNVTANQKLNSARSQPVLSQRHAVKEMATKLDSSADGSARTPNEKYRRSLAPKNTSPRADAAKLRKNTPASSEAINSSFTSNGTASTQASFIGTPPAVRVQPDAKSQPLFGEISPDGTWNGNFDFAGYAPRPGFLAAPDRRSSDGNIGTPFLRPHSQNSTLHPGFPTRSSAISHKRSRSDITAMQGRDAPALSQLVLQTFPVIQQVRPAVEQPPQQPPAQQASRIPVRGRKSSNTSQQSGPSRPASALASRQSVDTTVKQKPANENEKPSNRYMPPKMPQIGQMLSAKVVTTLPKISPPLRSSRPRQPVSSATTAASRARAANTQQASPSSPTPRTKPSEQWLGKPYDAKQEKSRRKIHEIGKIDFAERRARIQKAISRNLEESASVEQLRIQMAEEAEAQKAQASGADNVVDEHQASILEAETQALGLTKTISQTSPRKSLTVDTTNLPRPVQGESTLNTADTEITEFEIGETPDSAYGYGQLPISLQHQRNDEQQETPNTQLNGGILLSAATYVPPPRKKSPAPQVEPAPEPPAAVVSPESSPSDIEDKWGLKRGGVDTTGSIRIMLDDNPSLLRLNQINHARNYPEDAPLDPAAPTLEPTIEESPVVPQIFQSPPRGTSCKVVTADPPLLSQAVYQASASSAIPTESPLVAQAIDQFRLTGQIAPELLNEFDRHSLDLHRLSANGGSDAAIVQSLLDSILAQNLAKPQVPVDMPVTPHTPPGTLDTTGTVTLFTQGRSVQATPDRRSDDAVVGSDDEDDFTKQIRRADAEWERQLRGEEPMFQDEEPFRPPPPPKDENYTPHSSFGPDNASLDKWRSQTFRDSYSDSARNNSKNVDSVLSEEIIVPARTLTPSLPQHAPPPPPSDTQDAVAGSSMDVDRISVPSPRHQDVPSGSERPSVDSQRQPVSHPASQSASSLDQNRSATAVSPSPEQKRLTKRKNTIRELLDTENTYHQDLKIIEDIYKETATDIVSPEDRKILFGNCDEIEKFSLNFYDKLRKAASPIYMPSKNGRWGQRRGSMSTQQSDGQPAATDASDDSKDKNTYIGKVFLEYLLPMEQLYGNYLKNHDAANQRLSALQSTVAVKCWLDECHKNASDITSAWDLDSLLVKPTQRVSKYPLILQQLLEVTPADHPDHENLKSAARDTVAMLTRINEAKKRADIVEQMISGKRKDTDVRSGLAKAFGRRTERLKERVGINEAFQDPEFDALAQAFGGHYIRLQVTMRDFQDYVNQIEKAIQSTNNYSIALQLFTDVHQSTMPEIESKWRKYGQIIQELTAVSLSSHKIAVQKRVITPLIALIKIHESPQRAINKRKKHIVDYAKCKSIEKRGEKPDKKTTEASEMYEALNDQLKIELPQLYEMTGKLVMACLACFVESQLEWQQAFDRKLSHLLEAKDVPKSIQDIIPAFNTDFDFVKSRLTELGICNGSILAESANFLSSSTTLDGDSRRPSNAEGSRLGTDSPAQASSNRHSRSYVTEIPAVMETPVMPQEMRMRSNSSMSHSHTGQTPVTPIASLTAANRPWSNSVVSPTSAFSSRPSTATAQTGFNTSFSSVRSSSDLTRDRHDSSATFITARDSEHRFSGIFSSAMPPSDSQDNLGGRAASPGPTTTATDDARVLFTCASLYEFRIDKTRKEGGYSYHTYETGAIFDVIAQKGELWLALNQDDKTRTLGWIWEQHFVILTDHGVDGAE